jgi:hypothetical protein
MNRPEDFDQNQNNENQEYNINEEGKAAREGDPNAQGETRWYGISYQNPYGGYTPPMSFYDFENGRKKKGTKIALITVCALFLALLPSPTYQYPV